MKLLLIGEITIDWEEGTYTGEVSNGVPNGQGNWTHPAGQLHEQCDVSEAIIRNHYGRHLQPRMFKESLIQVAHLQNP